MDLNKIQILKDRMCGIVSKMKCSGNEKALAILDIGDTIDMLDQAESDFWDLDGYIADIKIQDEEIEDLKEENKKLKKANDSNVEMMRGMAESITNMLEEQGSSDE